MKNNFTPKSRDLFDRGGWMMDLEDGRNDADCLHHILGRCSNSPYNAAPLNNFRNHMPEGRKNLPAITSQEVKIKYLIKTKIFLDELGYNPNDKDLEFLEKYKKLYV